MSIVRSVEAKFTATANSMKSTIQGIKKDIESLATDTRKVTKGMSGDFKDGTRGITKNVSGLNKTFRDMSTSASKNFESIGTSIQNTGKSLEGWGSDIKDAGKKATVALSPLTAFYTAAALTGGSRLMANEQLDILMKNTFRTTEAYEDAWTAVNGLTKGTAFMNSDVGGWLSQLVQSNVELEKSEDIMKSVLDFSVGSGQLGVESEIQGIIMKAIRADGWDQMTLDMMAQRGLNLAGHIANVLGIETSAAQDMLKDGTISMEDSLDYFVDAVQVGSEGAGGYFAKMEGSAQKGGETMLGAWINTKAAIAKLGEDMWKAGAWDQLKEALNSFYEFIYELAPALEPMAGIIASVLATAVDWIQKIMTAFINLRPKTQALIAGLSVVGAVIGPVIFFFGKFVGIIGAAMKPLGGLFLWFGKIFKVIGAKGLGGAIKTLATRFSFLLGPVGIAVGVIITLVTAFIMAYKKSETFRNFIHTLGDKFKEVFGKVKKFIQPGIDAVIGFFNEIKNKINAFKNEEGAGLIKAFQNIGKFITLYVKAYFTVVKWAFDKILTIIKFVMPAALAVVKMVWGSIKGVISGTLDIILGAVKVFSGLFTGDFKKMWEGIKQMFSGQMKIIWNLIKSSFFGLIIQGVIGFVKSFGKGTKSFGKKIDGVITKVKDFATSVVNIMASVGTYFTWMWGLYKDVFSRLVQGFAKVKSSVVDFAKKVTDKFKEISSMISGFLSPVVDRVKEFFGEMRKKIQDFRETDGKELIDAFSKIKKFIGIFMAGLAKLISFNISRIVKAFKLLVAIALPIIKEFAENLVKNIKTGIDMAVAFFGLFLKVAWPIVEKAFNFIKGAIEKVMPILVFIIKTAWGNIERIISGAIDIIIGVVRVFIGLFTGDFKKMWEGIKDIFFGAVQFIWNLVQLMFWGRLLKGVIGFVKLFGNSISVMWTGIRSVFSTVIKWIVDFVKNRFASMNSTISTISNAIRNFISKIWNAILAFFRVVIHTIVDFIKNRFTNLRNNITTIFNAIRDVAKRVWNTIKDNIVNPITNAVKTAIDKFKGLKDSISTTFKNIKDSVFGYVADMVKKVKDMPGVMKKGITDSAHKVFDGMKSLASKMVEGLGKGVNGVITGINWVMGKLNVPKDKHIGKWTVPKYAHGTDGHPNDGLAIVGDGRGSNAGPELIQSPDGSQALSPDTDTLVNLQKGTKVLSAKNTRAYLAGIPRYKNGIGDFASGAWDATKRGAGAVKDGAVVAGKGIKKGAKAVAGWTGDVWDYIKDPDKLLNVALKTLGVSIPESASTFGKIAGGGFNKIKTSAIDYVKEKLNAFSEEGGDGGGPVSFGSLRKTSSFGMRFHPIFKQWRLHAGDDYGGKVGTAIKATTGGKVTSSGPSGTGFGTMVKVKNGMHDYIYAHLSRAIAKIGSSVSKGDVIGALGNTGNSTGPHLHYEVRKGGRPVKPGAYKDGGIVDTKQLAWIADGGWAESIISHDPAKKVRQQKIWQQTGDSLGFTSATQDKEMLNTLIRIAKAVERDFSIIMDSQKVGELTEPHVTNKQQRSQYRKRRAPR